jgi:hypothetical protein
MWSTTLRAWPGVEVASCNATLNIGLYIAIDVGYLLEVAQPPASRRTAHTSRCAPPGDVRVIACYAML